MFATVLQTDGLNCFLLGNPAMGAPEVKKAVQNWQFFQIPRIKTGHFRCYYLKPQTRLNQIKPD